VIVPALPRAWCGHYLRRLLGFGPLMTTKVATAASALKAMP